MLKLIHDDGLTVIAISVVSSDFNYMNSKRNRRFANPFRASQENWT